MPCFRGDFTFASETETRQAAVLMARMLQAARSVIEPRKRARLGLLADGNGGKTTFSNAAVKALGAKPCIKKRARFTQLKIPDGLILHGDAGPYHRVCPDFSSEEDGYDICEHAQGDLNTAFDLVVLLQRSGPCELGRYMMLFAGDDIVNATDFAALRESLEALEAAP